MAAGRVAMENRPQNEWHGGHRCEHAVTPPGITNLATPGEDGIALQQHGPFPGHALKEGGDTRDPGVTSYTSGF